MSGLLFGREREWRPQANVGINKIELCGHYTDDGIGPPTHPECAAKNRFVSGVQLLPQPVTEDHFLIPSNLAFLFREWPSQHWRDAQQVKPRGCHHHPSNLLRRAIQLYGLVALLEEGLALKNGHFAKAVEIVTRGGVVAARDSGIGVIIGHEKDGAGFRHR